MDFQGVINSFRPKYPIIIITVYSYDKTYDILRTCCAHWIDSDSVATFFGLFVHIWPVGVFWQTIFPSKQLYRCVQMIAATSSQLSKLYIKLKINSFSTNILALSFDPPMQPEHLDTMLTMLHVSMNWTPLLPPTPAVVLLWANEMKLWAFGTFLLSVKFDCL